ncbi:MAG: metal-dependent transcriptional regulator [Chloroflexi bacterium]|nr:metal-dependent transcriptional regulator [Chloroflexota bacterium]
MAAKRKQQDKRLMAADVSPLAENYLMSLYMLKEEAGVATMTRLADQLATSPATEHLGTSLPSVAGMVRRMKRDGLLDIRQNKEIEFTDKGLKHAKAIMRRHQLAERLLVDMLGMELHKVHAEAHRLEHAISPDVEACLAERLGNPVTCPFGHPIPGSGYEPPPNAMRLDKVKPGERVTVERIPEDDPRLVKYLVSSGVVRGAQMTVTDIAPYKGTMTMDVNGREVVVGLQVAPRIMVNPGNAKSRN